MREIKISIETAQRWANGTDEELKGLALQSYPELAKKQLPETWEELIFVKGYFIKSDSLINYAEADSRIYHKNIFATKEQAEASIALAQLSQLREVYRDKTNCYYNHIIFFDDKIKKEYYQNKNEFLSFQDEQTRDLFLENFRDLIEKAKPLMS